jgi:hypothetical protein
MCSRSVHGSTLRFELPREVAVKLLLAMTVSATVLLGISAPSVGADRDAPDRQTRQESDELRADIRQRRLKKIRDLEEARRQQNPAQGSKTNPNKGASGE